MFWRMSLFISWKFPNKANFPLWYAHWIRCLVSVKTNFNLSYHIPTLNTEHLVGHIEPITDKLWKHLPFLLSSVCRYCHTNIHGINSDYVWMIPWFRKPLRGDSTLAHFWRVFILPHYLRRLLGSFSLAMCKKAG